jgi:hypothetical protein
MQTVHCPQRKLGVLVLAAALCLGAAIGEATAQTPAPAPGDICQAFQRNDAGQWCPVRRVTISSPQGSQISLSPGACFKAGVQFNGMDIGRELDQRCH